MVQNLIITDMSNKYYILWAHIPPPSSGVPRGVWGGSTPPEIPKISVESSIAWARRTGFSISFCSSLFSHTVVIYEIKVSFNTYKLSCSGISGFEVHTHPGIPKVWQSQTGLQIERKMFSVPFQHPN